MSSEKAEELEKVQEKLEGGAKKLLDIYVAYAAQSLYQVPVIEVDSKSSSRQLLYKDSYIRIYREVIDGKFCAVKYPRAKYALRLEMGALAHLSHPNINQYYAIAVNESEYGLVMEPFDYFLPSVTFLGTSNEHKAMLVRWLNEAAHGLDFLHTRYDLIHTNITPRAILIRNGHALLTDLGMAVKVEKAAPQDTETMGLFVAPEAFKQEATVKSDVFSFGMVIYNQLIGRLPFHRFIDLKACYLNKDVINFDGELPHKLKKLVQSCCAYDPLQRPNMSTVAKELSEAYPALMLGKETPASELWFEVFGSFVTHEAPLDRLLEHLGTPYVEEEKVYRRMFTADNGQSDMAGQCMLTTNINLFLLNATYWWYGEWWKKDCHELFRKLSACKCFVGMMEEKQVSMCLELALSKYPDKGKYLVRCSTEKPENRPFKIEVIRPDNTRQMIPVDRKLSGKLCVYADDESDDVVDLLERIKPTHLKGLDPYDPAIHGRHENAYRNQSNLGFPF